MVEWSFGVSREETLGFFAEPKSVLAGINGSVEENSDYRVLKAALAGNG